MIKKYLLTGGHAGSTAYSLIQTIKASDNEIDIVFVGAKRAIEGKNIATLENNYFPKIGVKFVPIVSGRIQRKFSLWTIPSLVKIPVSFLHALFIVYKENPDVVVSFGGFSAFPVVVVAKILGKPVIIHEQTFSAGRSNIASAFFADKIALARKESLKYFPQDKCVVIGNPISREVAESKNKKESSMNNSILIAGGSRGSVFINDLMKNIIPKLLKSYKIYHQTGQQSYSDFKSLRDSLGPVLRKKYFVFSTVEMRKWYWYLENSDIIVSRSGANIVSECVHIGIPSIFIPIPYSYKNEQFMNASYAKKLGLARVYEQGRVKPDEIFREILNITTNWKNIVKNAGKPLTDDSKASEKLFKLISEYA